VPSYNTDDKLAESFSVRIFLHVSWRIINALPLLFRERFWWGLYWLLELKNTRKDDVCSVIQVQCFFKSFHEGIIDLYSALKFRYILPRFRINLADKSS
jgi:hypothetical protein